MGDKPNLLTVPKLSKLTNLQVKSAKKKIGDGGGLWLEVKPSGTKSWIFRYRLHGKDREMGLGAWPDISLVQAREEAAKYRNKKAEGIDPITFRNEERKKQALEASRNKTFAECLDEYLEAKDAQWSNKKHKQQWNNTLVTYAYPVIGAVPVSNVVTDDILKILKPIWQEKTETATRVRRRVAKVLDWATIHKYRQGENPARWEGHLKELLPAPEKIKSSTNYAALPYLELPAFMQELNRKDSISAKALKFCILTATRTGEVIGARWDEIDFKAKVWTIPADRMKANKEHEVPLVDELITLLESIPKLEGNPYIFYGARQGKHLSNMAMLKLLKEDMGRKGITVHGFRSTFRDWGAEQTSYPREVQEAALAHKLKDKAEAAYFRSSLLEKRRAMMTDWLSFACEC